MILRRPYLLTTVGSWSLVFLAAFESLAVTTVMPDITAELGGRDQYALAFSAALAAGIVGMVGFGAWADRRGPARALLTSIAVFTVGLVIAGTATAMPAFVLGRLVQGVGAGGHTVALYVLVAAVYPKALHIKIFGAFATAWVLPSMVGPVVAGVVAEAASWRWVFLGVVGLVVAATAMVLPALGGHGRRTGAPREVRKLGAAVVVAAGVVALGAAGTAWAVPVALVVVAVALRPLVPPGTFTVRPGLPAAVALCGFAGGVFIGTDVYLPLLLQERYGLPAWFSGLTLTAGAVAWALASAVQGRLGDRLDPGLALRTGAGMLAGGAFVELVTVVAELPVAVAAIGWFAAGAGMGTLYPRISALVLAYSKPGDEGFHTAAKSIADAVGASAALAVTGMLFTVAPFTGPFLLTTVLGVATIAVATRVAPLHRIAGRRSIIGRKRTPDQNRAPTQNRAPDQNRTPEDERAAEDEREAEEDRVGSEEDRVGS